MRRLAMLYLHLTESAKMNGKVFYSAENIFDRHNFEHFYCMSTKDCGMQKPGMMVQIGYLLETAAAVLKGTYLRREDDKVTYVDQFLAVLTKWQSMFRDSKHELNMQRQSHTRKPAHLPDENDLLLLHNYTVSQITKLTIQCNNNKSISSSEYKMLRSWAICKLTL